MKRFLHNLLDSILLRQRYIVFESECPQGLPKMGRAAGATSPSLDLALQPWLESRGEWAGRKPVIWIDDLAIRNATATNEEQLALAAVAIHEAAHVAEHRQTLRSYPEAVRNAVVKIAAYSEARQHHASTPPFFQHGWKFVRICSHLRQRARAVGVDVPGHWVFDGDVYELPSLNQFDSTLLGGLEARDLAAEPIEKINTFRPPRAFEELWQRSLRAWLAKQTIYSDAIRVAIDMVDVVPDPE